MARDYDSYTILKMPHIQLKENTSDSFPNGVAILVWVIWRMSTKHIPLIGWKYSVDKKLTDITVKVENEVISFTLYANIQN